MSTHPTFHTPSFGDEEFHLPQMQKNSKLIANDILVRGDVKVSASSGVQEVYEMTTANISTAAADTHSAAIVSNNFGGNGQWSMSNQMNNMRPSADVVTLTGNNFLVLRSPSELSNPTFSGVDNSSSAVHAAGMIDQSISISSDESDDNSGVNKSACRSPAAVAAIIDLKSKLKNDPNAPRKPVSAYAMFFGDTQTAIKSQNPNASFTEISKIVASMWDVLAPEHKEVYKKKAEDAKKEYRRLIAAYRANILGRSEQEVNQRLVNSESAAPIIQQSSAHQLQQSINVVPPTSGVICITNPLQQPQAANSNNVPTPTNNMEQDGDNYLNAISGNQTCIRNGCPNPAIVSPDWEDEYCSNECVVSHCAEIFSRWVKDYTATETYASS